MLIFLHDIQNATIYKKGKAASNTFLNKDIITMSTKISDNLIWMINTSRFTILSHLFITILNFNIKLNYYY